jgi:hypothetical protein
MKPGLGWVDGAGVEEYPAFLISSGLGISDFGRLAVVLGFETGGLLDAGVFDTAGGAVTWGLTLASRLTAVLGLRT